MAPETLVAQEGITYVPDLFRYNRRKTRVVYVGDVGVGGNNPIRVQSMTTTPTTDVEATVAQSVSLVKAGCEIVRITAPTLNDARALGAIKKALLAQGIKVPLVADIHFNPECAMEAANHVEKIRVNPGNYADSKIFKIKEYSDVDYKLELERVEERFVPLVQKLKSLGRSLRIGSNHGSLSDRIMNRYGDSPEGMVESALEFVRICEKNGFYDIILSMKSSNPKVMIAAYRLLAARMAQENMDYPFHLGVTEAGYGEDGRIKSAIGIGSLLNDGIGDTIRVSLTEDPEFEVPVAFQIAKPYQPTSDTGTRRHGDPGTTADEISASPSHRVSASDLSHVDNFFHYALRPTRELQIGPFKLGGENVVRVFSDLTPWLKEEADGKASALKILELLEQQLASGKDQVLEIIEWPVSSPEDLTRLQDCRRALGSETSRLAFLGRFTDPALAIAGLPSVHLVAFAADRALPGPKRQEQFAQVVRAAKAAGVSVLLESGRCHRGPLEPARNLLVGIGICEREGHKDLLVSLTLPAVPEIIANTRLAVSLLRESGKNYPIHLRLPEQTDFDTQRIDAAIAFGSLLCDGIGNSVQIGASAQPTQDLELIYNVLQGAGVRITKTEFVSCPSCGRTLFDLQTTTERIKKQTGHLKGVKIAIMGCIVNGPGEMADADFGYVGGAPGRINLYVGKDCVEKGIPTEQADGRLIQLIKTHGKWVDPK
jgi:(E)-4-hydroxy-3-methylbut-2-enyl-diphosphate synthase